MRSIAFTAGGVLAAILATSSVAAQGSHPSSIALDGGGSVPLAAQASRAHLVASVDLYSIAIYLNGSIRDAAAFLPRQVPKALRIEVTYQPDIKRPMPLDWQRELIPALEPAAMAELRRIIAPLRYGDVLQVDYTSEKGTTVRVNRDVAVSRGSHDLMLAFLDHWVGQRPVSEEMKQALLR